MTRKALVTGAAGFIGRRVTHQLRKKGYDVAGILRQPMSRSQEAGIGLSRVSDRGITSASLAEFSGEVDEIYHCAGSGSVAMSLQSPERDFASNVLTTQAVFEFARREGNVTVILPSSAGVYGTVSQMPIRANTVCTPISPYGTNKRICELLALQYARNFAVPTVIVRLFSVYGPGLRKQLLWDASRKMCDGDIRFFGTGEETRDWIHVDDAARLLIQSATIADTTAPTLNGGCGEAVEIRQIVRGLADRLGVSQPVAFTGEARAGDPQHYQADITEALATGWAPLTNLEDGLAEYAAWFLAQRKTSGAGDAP